MVLSPPYLLTSLVVFHVAGITFAPVMVMSHHFALHACQLTIPAAYAQKAASATGKQRSIDGVECCADRVVAQRASLWHDAAMSAAYGRQAARHASAQRDPCHAVRGSVCREASWSGRWEVSNSAADTENTRRRAQRGSERC